MMKFQSGRFLRLLLLFLLILAVPQLSAQSGTSSALAGTVVDASGAAVPMSNIELTEVNTKAIRSGRTDATGHYLFSQISPGTYQVSVSSAGFAPASSVPTAVP